MADEWDLPEDLNPQANGDLTPINSEITIEWCLERGVLGVDIPNEVYHSLPGISGSNLELLKQSNLHLDNKSLFRLTDSPALINGSLLHTMVLEPDTVTERYCIMPKFEGKAITGRTIAESVENFHIDNKDKIIIEQDIFNRIGNMARNVRAICGKVIDSGVKERSYFVEIDGIILKSRLDIESLDDGSDWDLKSITLGVKPFSDATIEQHIKKFNYHLSAALRNIVRKALGIPVGNTYLIFVDTGNGHRVRPIQIEPDWILQAETEVNELLENRRLYLESGRMIDVSQIAIIDDHYRKIL